MSTTENNAEKNESGGRLRLIGAAYLIVYICALNSLCTQFIACLLYTSQQANEKQRGKYR